MARRTKISIETDAAIVDAQLASLRAREADFQKILDDMQRLKDSVSLERRELGAKRKELHNERQPINWLPAKLLIHIFLTLTDADSDTSHDPSEVYHHAPVVISHRSSWCSIFLSTSQMWSRISVRTVVWNGRLIVAFLALSGTTPVDIIFICSEVIPSEVDSYRADIAFRSRAMAMQRLIGVLTLPENEFSSLRTLELSLLSWGPTSSRRRRLWYLSNCMGLGLVRTKSTTPGYTLRMSQLFKFLACTPKLQELVLANIIPYMDVSLNVEDAVQISDSLQKMDRVELIHLHTLDWAYPFGPDIHYFLSFLDCPALEKLLSAWKNSTSRLPTSCYCGATQPPPRHSSSPPTGSSTSRPSATSVSNAKTKKPSAPWCASSRFLSSKTSSWHTSASAAAQTEAEAHWRSRAFRDPCLPALTHFTFCRFQISAEPGKAEAILGTMPALVSLTLDGWAGVHTLLDGLSQRGGDGGGARVPGDLAISEPPNGGAGTKGAVRAIRPMKKLRRQGRGVGAGAGEGRAPSTNILSSSMMIAMEEAGRPARIGYVRIGYCTRISEEDVMSLKALGVAEVAWTGDPAEEY
ncbi:hypothetical protein DFH08DRAFT_936624 [Mycena albidolilacea]|uniref:F-box domain-containing protein n=1 Tax=Mycena albidolilacea TaxID=1033008 RepID=A0AAD7ER18_9AGAR|nr:hypothetical protein DFH08DRAFT_936624 [Mycena albidolilacea]